MSKGIELSPKYGVNPTIPVCFFCGQPKNEIALLGRIRDKRKSKNAWGGESTQVHDSDMEAPKHCVLDYEPCDKCRENMSMGVTLLGVTTTQPRDGRPPLTAKGGMQVYPSGKWCVVKTEAAQRMFDQTFQDDDKLFLEDALLTQIVEGAEH